MKNLSERDRADLYDYAYKGGNTPRFLYEHYMEDMPYGTQKARTGDPDNWLADHFDRIEDDFSEELETEAKKRGAQ